MEGDRVDRPLTVERLSTADLIAAAKAVVAIVTMRYWRDATTILPQTIVCVTWVPNPPGEMWTIELMDWSPGLVGEDAQKATEALLRPIVEEIRPRALMHRFRSKMDEISRADLEIIANAGVSPDAAFYEPRWVEDRTILTAGTHRVVDREAITRARESLADVYARLALTPPPELDETAQDAFPPALFDVLPRGQETGPGRSRRMHISAHSMPAWPTKAAPTSPHGFIGMTLETARATHFFQWFHLEPAAPPGDGSFLFRPSGAKFLELAAVALHTDAAQCINAIDLIVARAFIEDPHEGVFAADIGKSFIEAALAAEDRAHMQHLIDTIAYGGRYARPIITAAAADRPQPRIERESAPYLVWRGENDYWQRPFNAVRLVLENVTSGGGAALRILVEVR